MLKVRIRHWVSHNNHLIYHSQAYSRISQMASSKGQNRTSRERPGGNCTIQQEGNAPGTITCSCRWGKVIGRFPRLVCYSENVSHYTGILVWMVSLRAFIEYIGMMIPIGIDDSFAEISAVCDTPSMKSSVKCLITCAKILII